MTYEREDEITKELSLFCDGRVVWGGDATIEHMREYPLKPTSSRQQQQHQQHQRLLSQDEDSNNSSHVEQKAHSISLT